MAHGTYARAGEAGGAATRLIWKGIGQTMSDFRVLATNHTSFTVSDLDRSIAFFTEALGFEILNRAPRDPKLIEGHRRRAGRRY